MLEEPSTGDDERRDAERVAGARPREVEEDVAEQKNVVILSWSNHVGELGSDAQTRRQMNPRGTTQHQMIDE